MKTTQNVQKKYLSALDEYINKVYILVLLLVPGACECAGLSYTFSKFMGWLPTVSWVALIIFDVTCLLYLAIGIFFRVVSITLISPGSLIADAIASA